MAKRASSKSKGTFQQGMKALGSARVPKTEIGKFNNDGTITLDHKALAGLKKKLGKATSKKVRFVALNAPFKRRSPTLPG
jgi:hypothetical protein